MEQRRAIRGSRLVLWASLAGLALVSLTQLLAYDPVPWGWVAGVAVGTAVLAGPVAWVLRERLRAERRDSLALVAAGVALLAAPFVVGLGLVYGNLLLVLNAGAFGGIVGLAAATLLERTVVPERRRGSVQ